MKKNEKKRKRPTGRGLLRRPLAKKPAPKASVAMPPELRLRSIVLSALFVVVGFGLVIWRLYTLQIRDGEIYRAQASAQQLLDQSITAMRGNIYDATGKTLARSTAVYDIVADPNICNQGTTPTLTLKQLKADSEEAEKAAKSGEEWLARFPEGESYMVLASEGLAEILGVDSAEILEKLTDAESQYKVLAKNVSKPVADEVEAFVTRFNKQARLSALSVDTRQKSKREYPYGAFLASVLGFCNDEGEGFYGLEKYYEAELAGVDGRIMGLRNAWGYELDDPNTQVYEAQDGQSLTLTIDVNIQEVAERYLSAALESNNVQNRGCAIVMDVNTGAILAMASKPDFDPNQPYEIYDAGYRQQLEAASDEEYTSLQGALRERQWRNKTLTELYYPGSIFKLITSAAALDSGFVTAAQSYNCSGAYSVANITYNCAGGSSHGVQDMALALANSCNLYFIQLGQLLGKEVLSDYFNAFGFTETTGVDLPSETPYIQYYTADQMGEVELASTSFGQAQKVTPLQMVTAAAAVVNGGYLVTPHVVGSIQDAEGNTVKTVETEVKRQVVSEEVSSQMRTMMEGVVGGGADGYSGRNAYVAGYRIGGKSGTSEQLDEDRRAEDDDYKKVSSFLAVLPINDPQILVFAMLDDPRGENDYASVISAPIVGNIISEVAPYLGLETDGSTSSGTVETPNCVGRDWTLAQVELNKKGLGHRLVGNSGAVTWQYPYAGEEVPEGTTVYLYTGAAADTLVTTPDVRGQTVSFASQMLRAASLNVKVVGEVEGTVSTQSVLAGTQTPMGTVVEITAEAPAAEPAGEPETTEEPLAEPEPAQE